MPSSTPHLSPAVASSESPSPGGGFGESQPAPAPSAPSEGGEPPPDFETGLVEGEAPLPEEVQNWNPAGEEAPSGGDEGEEDTGPPPRPTPFVGRSGLALLPTAYSNRPDQTGGFNLDLLFSYYIGSIVEKRRGAESTEVLNPLRLWLLTADAKIGLLEEGPSQPAVAAGFLNTLLLEGGSPGATAQGGQSLKFTASSLGSLYAVAGKSLGSGSSVHVGYLRGNLRDPFGGAGFLHKALPNRNHSELLPLLSEDLADVRGDSAPNLIFTGFGTPFLGTVWRFEAWKPFPLARSPVLLNTKVERLFSFHLAYGRWDGGWSLLGYFNFRFTIVPSEKSRQRGLENF